MKFWDLSRRNFFRALGGLALGGLASRSALLKTEEAQAASDKSGPLSKATNKARAIDIRRYTKALKTRLSLYRRSRKKRLPRQRSNKDLKNFGAAFAYTKVLPKDDAAEPNPAQFGILQQELKKGKLSSFENTVASGAKGFKNPIGAHAVDLVGYDASQFTIRPAPSVASAEGTGEMAELYWQALCRDVKFEDYWTDTTVSDAAGDLTNNHSALPAATSGGMITPGTIFRSTLPGRLTGPFVSQLLLQDVPTGRLLFNQKIEVAEEGSDWMTDERFFNFRQGGNRDGNSHVFKAARRHIITGRDLASYVWDDRTFAPYLHAFYILLYGGVKLNPGNPYRYARASTGFLSGEYPHGMALVAEVASAALKPCWWQKWLVHMRLRPEELGGRIHYHKTGKASYSFLPAELLNAESVSRIFDYNGAIDTGDYPGNAASYLLPQAYPEGSPNHPAYPSGHATMAGACATVLKAWFDETEQMPNAMIPSSDGLALTSYSGETLTVGSEINKLASNIAEARNFAGIHYRSDMEEGLRLGEAVAIELLRQRNACFAENFRFEFTKFDGSRVVIK